MDPYAVIQSVTEGATAGFVAGLCKNLSKPPIEKTRSRLKTKLKKLNAPYSAGKSYILAYKCIGLCDELESLEIAEEKLDNYSSWNKKYFIKEIKAFNKLAKISRTSNDPFYSSNLVQKAFMLYHIEIENIFKDIKRTDSVKMPSISKLKKIRLDIKRILKL